MKLVAFRNKEGQARAGWLKDKGVVDMNLVSHGQLPTDMLSFIDRHEEFFALIRKSKLDEATPTHALSEVKLLAPLPIKLAVCPAQMVGEFTTVIGNGFTVMLAAELVLVQPFPSVYV